MSTIPADGSGNAIYLRMSGNIIQYATGTIVLPLPVPDSSWNNISIWPVTIRNTNPYFRSILNVNVTTNLTISNTYGGQSGYFIVGSEYITFNGARYTINTNNITFYFGFIRNGTGNDSGTNGFSNIIVENFITDQSTLDASGNVVYLSNLAPGGNQTKQGSGWLCQWSFGRGASGNKIRNCTNISPIQDRFCGGVVGSLCGAGLGGEIEISNCVNNGSIATIAEGQSCGGIVGAYAGYDNGVVIINDCSNNGVIGRNDYQISSAGICGAYMAENNGNVTINRCVNTGRIIGEVAGGIVGSFGARKNGLLKITSCTNSGEIFGWTSGGIAAPCLASEGTAIVTNCINTGAILGRNGGGIAGYQGAKTAGKLTISSCTNSGVIGIRNDPNPDYDKSGLYAGGIVGAQSGDTGGVVTIENCVNTNTAIIYGPSAGGILGAFAGGGYVDDTAGGVANANGCINNAQIVGSNAGGIAGGTPSFRTATTSFFNCINNGTIYGQYAGGIVASSAGASGGFTTINACENTGDISGNYAGGIAGTGAGGQITFSNCINRGTIYGQYTGGIAGSDAANYGSVVVFSDCINDGNIMGTRVAGIAGSNVGFGGSVTFNRCRNTGIIGGTFSGGIVGIQIGNNSLNNSNSVTFNSCRNSGVISAVDAGGIAGASAGFTRGNVTFTNCANSGVISALNAGGIAGVSAGDNSGNVIFIGCVNTGFVNGTYAGGIAGKWAGGGGVTNTPGGIATFIDCSNNGGIIAQNAGGIVGYQIGYRGGNVTLRNCRNGGEISGRYSGGISGDQAGYTGVATFINCANGGLMFATNGGGIAGQRAGYTGVARFEGCTNNGIISGESGGGIAGDISGDSGTATFISCVNTALVGAYYSGGIAGSNAGYNGFARFENCENTGSININGYYSGGIAGRYAGSFGGGNAPLNFKASVEFIGCINRGLINRSDSGGITGDFAGAKFGGKAIFTGCVNYGLINAGACGGIAGPTAGTETGVVTFTDCVNYGNVTGGSGGIAGEWTGSNGTYNPAGSGSATFLRCINNGNISGDYSSGITSTYAGGGFMGKAIFTNCTNNGIVGGDYGGGITGNQAGGFGGAISYASGCINNGVISAKYAGGIVGPETGILISNCMNNGDINGEQSGGIAGFRTGATFTDCTNNGVIRGPAAGGITGYYAGVAVNPPYVNNTIFTRCKNTGEIQATEGGGIAGQYAARGGSYTSSATFIECTNTGVISGVNAGGIAGSYAGFTDGKARFTDCTNTGVVSGINAGGIAGGYAGSGNGASTLFQTCINSGNITSQYGGGIVGAYAGNPLGSVTINKCYSIGNILGEYSGGIIGGKFASNTNRKSNVSNCYSTGNIDGSIGQIKAGGIVGADIGYTNSGLYTPVVDISNCYSLGIIGTSCGGICGGVSVSSYTNKPTIRISNCYSYGLLIGTAQGIVAVSLTPAFANITTPNTYAANGIWNDANANASLQPGTTPTNIKVNNPGSVWTTLSTTFSPGVPYVLSIFNDTVYVPASATSSNNYYSSGPGKFQPDYTYSILYSNQSGNVLTTRVFSSKGISPYYYSYNNNIFTFTNTNGITSPNNLIYVAIVKSTGVLNFTSPITNDPQVIQIPNPFNPYAVSPNNKGEVIYTDASYIVVPNISINPTYILSTDVTNTAYDVFQFSEAVPASFIPNSLFINSNLISPGGIVKDSLGKFYICNTAYNVISVYDNAGIYLRNISVYSSINIPLNSINYIAIDSSNNLYVTCDTNTGVFVIPAGNSTNDLNGTILKYIYGNDLRGLTCNANYLYIIKQSSPKSVIKYNLNNKTYLQLDLSGNTTTGEPLAIIYNTINTSLPPLYITTIDGSNNSIYTISNITGIATLIGGVGSATITRLTRFPDNQYPYSLTMDNSANLYVGLEEGRNLPVNVRSVGKIARVTTTGSISNTSYLTYNNLGIGRPEGLLFEGSLYLYVTDILHNRVIKSRPKTFVFGPSVLNADAFYVKDPSNNTLYKTYLYDITNSVIATTFNLTADCFQKGTKILCENDIYVPIENIKVGDLVKTYKHGYQKVIRCVTRRSCDYVISSKNQIYTYTQKSNPELIEDLYLTGGHSLLVDALSETESNDMKQAEWLDSDFIVEDKYKLMCCFNKKLDVSASQNVELYRFTLEPPENATPTHVYGIWANGILSESSSKASMDK